MGCTIHNNLRDSTKGRTSRSKGCPNPNSNADTNQYTDAGANITGNRASVYSNANPDTTVES